MNKPESYGSTGTPSLSCSAFSPNEAHMFLDTEHVGPLASYFQRFLGEVDCRDLAPERAKLMVSVPMPQPISSTLLPLHRSNSAKPGM